MKLPKTCISAILDVIMSDILSETGEQISVKLLSLFNIYLGML